MSTPDDKKDPNGVGTTGHSWDGIEELNNPMPRWWLWTFYACVAYALVYSVLMPAWPWVERATPGLLGWATRANVAEDIAEFEARNAAIREQLVQADLTAIAEDPDLRSYATNSGAAVFRTFCAQCHGAGAAGAKAAGYPNLLDDDWLWGGTIEDIHQTIAHGIRNEDPDSRWSQMPAFGRDGLLDAAQIADVVQHVRAISGQEHDATMAATGAEIYAEQCSGCHMEDGTGDIYGGAPNLTDRVWLYGGDVDTLTHTITYARFGVMPSWQGRLDEAEIRAVATYVHGLGGGQ